VPEFKLLLNEGLVIKSNELIDSNRPTFLFFTSPT